VSGGALIFIGYLPMPSGAIRAGYNQFEKPLCFYSASRQARLSNNQAGQPSARAERSVRAKFDDFFKGCKSRGGNVTGRENRARRHSREKNMNFLSFIFSNGLMNDPPRSIRYTT